MSLLLTYLFVVVHVVVFTTNQLRELWSANFHSTSEKRIVIVLTSFCSKKIFHSQRVRPLSLYCKKDEKIFTEIITMIVENKELLVLRGVRISRRYRIRNAR